MKIQREREKEKERYKETFKVNKRESDARRRVEWKMIFIDKINEDRTARVFWGNKPTRRRRVKKYVPTNMERDLNGKFNKT